MTLAPLTQPSPPRGEGIRAKDAEASAGHKQKPQPKGCGFFIGSTCCQQQANRP